MERSQRHPTIDTPCSLGEVLAEHRYRRDRRGLGDAIPRSHIARRDAVWPLVAAAIVLVLLGWTGKIERMVAMLSA